MLPPAARVMHSNGRSSAAPVPCLTSYTQRVAPRMGAAGLEMFLWFQEDSVQGKVAFSFVCTSVSSLQRLVCGYQALK